VFTQSFTAHSSGKQSSILHVTVWHESEHLGIRKPARDGKYTFLSHYRIEPDQGGLITVVQTWSCVLARLFLCLQALIKQIHIKAKAVCYILVPIMVYCGWSIWQDTFNSSQSNINFATLMSDSSNLPFTGREAYLDASVDWFIS
jgi:hypothetical protein